MKTDGLFGTHICEVRAKLNEPLYIVPFGDIHRESENFAHEEWSRFLEREKKRIESGANVLYLGMGDYADGCSTSERRTLLGELHETTRISLKNMYKGVIASLANELDFMRGRIIGMLGGNHYYELENGENTDHLLASLLGARYLGCTALVRLNVQLITKEGKKQERSTNIDIFANHGKGGGKSVGSTFNSIEDMQKIADADLYLMGHDHKKGGIPSFPRMRLVTSPTGGVSIRARTPYLGRTGSFLKNYENGKRSYGVDALYPACALGVIEFEYIPRRIRKDSLDMVELEVTCKS